MIQVTSYFKLGEDFIPVSEFGGNIHDPDYVEGGIELSIKRVPLITLKMWDYIDQLWAYIVDGLEEVKQGNHFSTFFPDQPIEMIFTPQDDGSLKIIVDCDTEVVMNVDRKTFLHVLGSEAQQFFNKMSALLPEKKSMYEKTLKRIEKIL